MLDLKRYYTSLFDLVHDPVQQRMHGFPHIAERDKFSFSYVGKLVPFNEGKPVFIAKHEDNGEAVVVKFTGAYNEGAHRLLEYNGYAPALYHLGKTTLGLSMVIMQYVEGTQLSEGSLTEAQLKGVKEAIKLLHARNLVFGDLRNPNVLVKDDDDDKHALLIDFDGCGKDGEGLFPFDINMELPWVEGVGLGAIMKKQHDLEMLGKL